MIKKAIYSGIVLFLEKKVFELAKDWRVYAAEYVSLCVERRNVFGGI